MAETFGLTVAAWAPLAHGALAWPKATEPGEPEPPMVEVVLEVADELGVSPARVALAWTRARSRAVHPLVGPRTVAELEDNLAALEQALS